MAEASSALHHLDNGLKSLLLMCLFSLGYLDCGIPFLISSGSRLWLDYFHSFCNDYHCVPNTKVRLMFNHIFFQMKAVGGESDVIAMMQSSEK